LGKEVEFWGEQGEMDKFGVIMRKGKEFGKSRKVWEEGG
jgi:hypothetical protein